MDKILLFIPMYNCQKQIVRVLAQLKSEASDYISQAIVVNNRSTDDGEQAVIDFLQENKLPIPVTLLRNDENYGLGGSHKVAFDYAINNGFDYVIVLHGDDQGDISNILPHLKNREYANFDAFLGARFMKGSKLQSIDGHRQAGLIKSNIVAQIFISYSLFRTVGNRVYNLCFSVGAGRRVFDLGSGLNMYKVKSLESRYYLKFKDNLMFNCYMLLAAGPLKHKIRFFPILWREDDQVSNVKMVNQAVRTLKMLMAYMKSHSSLLTEEHRDKPIENYTAQPVYSYEV